MEVLYQLRLYFLGICSLHRPYIYAIGTSNESVPEMASDLVESPPPKYSRPFNVGFHYNVPKTLRHNVKKNLAQLN